MWSRSVESDASGPPSKGWRVPWDAECVEGLLLLELLEANGPKAPAPVAPPVAPPVATGPPAAFAGYVKPKVQVADDQSAERSKLATERVAAAEADVEQAITSTRRAVTAEEMEESSLLEAESALRAQLVSP